VQRLIVQNEIYKEILSEDRGTKRDIELDTPGSNKAAEKVFTEAADKYYPRE
jgi:hypothetical protein